MSKPKSDNLDLNFNLIDLHIHVGGAVAPHTLWRLAHEQGFKLPVHNYWEFKKMITASVDNVSSLDDYLKILHEWTEKIQSSPLAVEQSVYEIIGKEYRSSNVTAIELRFNPMKRNSGGVLDLDHIIHAALRGVDRVSLEYGVEAGLIFCLAREFDYRSNEILVQKAIKYRDRGVVGIDLAGPEKKNIEKQPELLASYGKLFQKARESGLKTTVHTGETRDSSPEAVMAIIKHLKPHRIGHGIQAAKSKEALKMLRDEGIVLELCPTCNLSTRSVQGVEELASIFAQFDAFGIRYTINTDGPYLLNTNLRNEFKMLLDSKILDRAKVLRCLEWAKESSFISSLRYQPTPAFKSGAAQGEE